MFDNKGGAQEPGTSVQLCPVLISRSQNHTTMHKHNSKISSCTAELSRVKVWGCQTLLIPDHTHKNSESLALKFASVLQQEKCFIFLKI